MHKKRTSAFRLFLIDAILCFFSIAFSYLILGNLCGLIPSYETGDWIKFWLFATVAYYFAFTMVAPHHHILDRTYRSETFPAIKITGFYGFALAILLLLGDCRIVESRFLFCGNLILFLIFTYVVHILYRHLYKKYSSQGANAVLVGVVTTEDRLDEFMKALKKESVGLIKKVALVGTPVGVGVGASSAVEEDIISDDFDSFLDWVRVNSIDQIYIDLPAEKMSEFCPFIEEMEDMGVVVHMNLSVLEPYTQESRCFLKKSYTFIEDRPMATLSSSPSLFNHRQMVLKRLLDLFGGIVGSIISVPVILLVAIPLLIESPGPLIFKQKRVGRNGRIFTMYKLRSMYKDAEERKKELMEKNEMDGLMFKVSDDPRITRVGKFIRKTSIDELPQFWNVLRGDMSLVGTRPPTLDEYTQYKSRHKRRLSMKPGITGLWQVSGRSDISDFEDVVRLDLKYIDNWTVWLDIRILFRTVFSVLINRGAK